MEGIPADDLRDHEKQKTGGKSESEDDEPATKRAKQPDGILIDFCYYKGLVLICFYWF